MLHRRARSLASALALALDDNRELGLIISDHTVLAAMASTFAADFRNGTHWT